MGRDVLWISLDERTVEHLRLTESAEGFEADGLIIHSAEGTSQRIHYRISGDPAWRIRNVVISHLDSLVPPAILRSGGRGRWHDGAGVEVPTLEGCHDVDIQGSPFTNTLAIRRLGLPAGAAAEICAAFVTVPELEVRAFRQRYTRLASGSGTEVYRYESLESDFRADLPVDEDGLLLEYPGFFRRAGTLALPR